MDKLPLIRISGLSKSYGGVHALRDIDLDIGPGEVHALCGENGAGKSTLIRILTGVVRPDRGHILIDGKPLIAGSVGQSEDAGIGAVHQESAVFPDLNGIDNVFVGRERTRGFGWLLDRHGMRRATQSLIDRLGTPLNLDVPVRELSIAQRQIVAMARALARHCRLLILDEPTASLSAREVDKLLEIVRQLRRDGVSVLYVSHRLSEVFQIADRVTVLRDGQKVSTSAASEQTESSLIRAMVGREITAPSNRADRSNRVGRVVLQVQRLSRAGVFADISLAVHAGEIAGLAGLIGAGRSEVARAIFGIDRYDAGEVLIAGQRLAPGSVPASMAAGIALVPEDRQHQGLVLPLSICDNLTLAVLPTLSRFGFVRRHREQEVVRRLMTNLAIRAAHPSRPAATLSGGNQQRVVLGKWLATDPKVLILDEPTRGIDVAARAQIHDWIRDLAARGVAILVISSDLPELLAICDRLIVMRQGRMAGEVPGGTATQEQVMSLALRDQIGDNS